MNEIKHLATLIGFLTCCVSSALADDIDKAFGAQTKSEKAETRTDSAVQNANGESRQGVVTRVLAREQARREEMNRLAASSSTTDNESKSAKTPPPANGNFTCDFICSTTNMVMANNRSPLLNVSVSARDAQQARDLALPSAKTMCWDHYKMVPYERWGTGFLSCKKN